MTTTAPAVDEIDGDHITGAVDEIDGDRTIAAVDFIDGDRTTPADDDIDVDHMTAADDQIDGPPTFADLGIPEGLSDLLGELGFASPFPVQTATMPDAIAGRDVAARAPTGSGKTLAFGVPLLMRVHDARPRHPRGLVLAPTRELADQIQRELAPIAQAGGRRVVAIYGGVGYEPQRRALRRGVDVLVACPGRLADLIEQGDLDLDEVEVVVIDEADRMSDMGFLPEVKRLLNRTPDDRQTLLFSATLDGDVGVLVRDYQRNSVRHEVGDADPNIEDMRHLFWRLDGGSRIQAASDLIQAAGRTIVFVRTRHGADRVAKQLESAGATAAAIHGARSQNQRNRALKSFADGRVEALVATDVAARGIHVDGVACVLHFDPPVDDKTYVHRSGRTARAGAQGVVVSFIANDQRRDADRLIRNLRLDVDLNTPAPTSMQGARERLESDPGESFADDRLVERARESRGPSSNGGGQRGPSGGGGGGGYRGGGAPRGAGRGDSRGAPRDDSRSAPRGRGRDDSRGSEGRSDNRGTSNGESRGPRPASRDTRSYGEGRSNAARNSGGRSDNRNSGPSRGNSGPSRNNDNGGRDTEGRSNGGGGRGAGTSTARRPKGSVGGRR